MNLITFIAQEKKFILLVRLVRHLVLRVKLNMLLTDTSSVRITRVSILTSATISSVWTVLAKGMSTTRIGSTGLRTYTTEGEKNRSFYKQLTLQALLYYALHLNNHSRTRQEQIKVLRSFCITALFFPC